MSGGCLLQGWSLFNAQRAIGKDLAAWVERAPRRQCARIGRGPLNRDLPVRPLVQRRKTLEERRSVGMLWVFKDVVHSARLNNRPGVHDRHSISNLGNHSKVMGYEHDCRAGLCLDHPHEIEDLGLDGHIEFGGGLIGNNHAWPVGDRHCDHASLAHPAGELVGVLIYPVLGLTDSHARQQLHCSSARRPLRQLAVVYRQHFPELRANGVRRMQRRGGILEDHRHSPTSDIAEQTAVALQQVFAAQ